MPLKPNYGIIAKLDTHAELDLHYRGIRGRRTPLHSPQSLSLENRECSCSYTTPTFASPLGHDVPDSGRNLCGHATAVRISGSARRFYHRHTCFCSDSASSQESQCRKAAPVALQCLRDSRSHRGHLPCNYIPGTPTYGTFLLDTCILGAFSLSHSLYCLQYFDSGSSTKSITLMKVVT
jgi:hypothetical protein